MSDGDVYLLELVRYIHLNPVRAGLVETPGEYPWTGHRAYLGIETVPWLTSDWCLSQFSSDLRVARRNYAAFVLDGIEQGRRDDLYKVRASGRILGEDHFIERVLAQAEEHAGKRMLLDGIVAVVCSVFAVDEAGLLTPGRKQIPSRMRGDRIVGAGNRRCVAYRCGQTVWS